MHRSFITLPLLLLGHQAISQSVTQEVFTSSGNTENTTLVWTVGQPFIASYESSGAIVTEGFHQTKITVTSVENPLSDVAVFPNPTHRFINIEVDNDDVYDVTLTNELGQPVKIDFTQVRRSASLDAESVSSGIYILSLKSKKNQRNVIHKISITH